MKPFWHVYQGILSAFTMSHLSRWLFSCWSILIYQILDHETPHWFMALALPSLLPFAKVCQSDIPYLSSVMSIYHSRLCVVAHCVLILSSGAILTYWSHVEPTHQGDTIYQRDQTVAKKLAAVTFKFSRVSHMDTLVPRQVGHTDAVGWYHLDNSTWISPRHFTLCTLPLSHQTCPSKASLFFVNDMSSSHLLSPENWSHQEFLHFFHPSYPLHPFFPNL